MISFLLNQQQCTEQTLDPNMTVLEYLRTKAGKTGTKEGCASGDCGACTVVLGELDGDNIRYKSINACLAFVSSLNNKQLISVEDLQQGEQLHPSQQAMVDCHGSQCGFCTPGFVMSMFALGKNVGIADKDKIHESLAGNLCRCTGYRPIIDAAVQMYDVAGPDQFERNSAETVAKLKALKSQQMPTLNADGKEVYNPRTIDELAQLYSENPDALLVAGGTDLALEVTQFQRELKKLIYIGDITQLQKISLLDDCIEFGAGASLSDCYAVLSEKYADFAALLHRFASLQIRNQGTLGGNIGNASPIGDAPPALIALNAQVVLRCAQSSRTLALEDYFIDYKVTAQQPAEFIEKIILPLPAANGEFRSYKISKRIDDDISAVLGCFNITLQQGRVTSARIAYGGMAAIPKRASHSEAALCGSEWNLQSIALAKEALAKDFSPISDFRASKEYRMLTAANMLTRYFTEISSPATATRVTDYV